ncbi:conserved hypothetical protein [Solidesulfovibrio fructosivorans JJ]]|uniref:DUF4386 family protein n=1 Tax=Solidesulfovibrio fructosivorans JJ] TaxID=596151 RepID=E1JRJ5_SOLFR|nr:hypothetical protein [Solidesulfovibrio fructosivorans]EFL53196.1 conserved hypothetical protein [Solidesulfovibrio fructosivorans JJ]]
MEFKIDADRLRLHLKILGIGGSILMLWNGVCDLIYGYSATLSGPAYFSPAVITTVLTADGRPHWVMLLAQTAGWLYPLFALTYFPWWIGMRRAGFWLGTLPVLLLVYALMMIGGIQHAGFAFLSVLEQAKAVVGCTDPNFFDLANRYIIEHFAMGDLTAATALDAGAILLAIGILSGRTIFPRWFVILSPLGTLVVTMGVGVLLPAPAAGYVLAPFGTWFMLVPNIAVTLWLWTHMDLVPKDLIKVSSPT